MLKLNQVTGIGKEVAPCGEPQGVWVFALVNLLALCACLGPNRPIPHLPPPPGAIHGYFGEELRTAVDITLADLHSRLRDHFKPRWDVNSYTIPAGAGWDSIKSHYSQALGPDWQVDSRYSEDAGVGYRSKVWSDGRRAVAIALNMARGAGKEHVLTVFIPDDGR